MTDSFLLTFAFESEHPSVAQALDIIKTKIFEDCTISVPAQPEWTIQLEEVLECYNFASELEEGEEDPRNTNIPESEGTRDVGGPQLETPAITEPIKIKKVNIGTDAEPKFASIGDYWNDETVGQIVDLLHDYQDLFPTKFIEMKGIVRDLGVMRIPLKEDARLVKQRPYRLNPRYKEKVKDEIDKMLAAGIIEPVEESEWVSPMVVQKRKQKETSGSVSIYASSTMHRFTTHF